MSSSSIMPSRFFSVYMSVSLAIYSVLILFYFSFRVFWFVVNSLQVRRCWYRNRQQSYVSFVSVSIGAIKVCVQCLLGDNLLV